MHRTACPGTTSTSGIGWVRHLGRTYGQRGASRQPTGGLMGEVGSPASVIRSRVSQGLSTGVAEINARVYGWNGRLSTTAVGPSSMMWPRYMTATRVDRIVAS